MKTYRKIYSPKDIGHRIAMFRNSRHLTLKQLAEKLRLKDGKGNLSKIENGKRTPTIENLFKIADGLELTSAERAVLFKCALPVNIINKFAYDYDLNNIFQEAADKIQELGIYMSTVLITEGDQLRSTTFTSQDNSFMEIFNKIVGGKPFNQNTTSLANDNDNIIVQSILKKKCKYTKNMFDATVGVYDQQTTKDIVKFEKFQCAFSVPILYEGNPIGAMFHSKDYMDSFKYDEEYLKKYTNEVGRAIVNARALHQVKFNENKKS